MHAHCCTVFHHSFTAGAWEGSLFKEDPFKSPPKVLVENSVDDWIESRVGVAQPESYIEAPLLHATGGIFRGVDADWTHRADGVQKEEREPTGNKRAHD